MILDVRGQVPQVVDHHTVGSSALLPVIEPAIRVPANSLEGEPERVELIGGGPDGEGDAAARSEHRTRRGRSW